MKIVASLLFVSLSVAFLPAPARSQESDPKAALDAFTKSLQDLRPQGKNAYKALRDLRRKHKDATLVITGYRKQVRDAEPASTATVEGLQPALDAFGQSAEAIVKLGTAATPHIAKTRDEIKAKADALPADKAAEKTTMLLDAEVFDTLHQSIWVTKARAILLPFKGLGTCLGMFDEHRAERADLAKAWMTIFRMEDEDAEIRGLGAEGVVQFAEGDERAAFAKEFREVFDNPNDTGMRAKSMYCMARLGDRAEFEKSLEPIKQKIEAELKKETPDQNMLVGAHYELARHYQEVHEFDEACKNYSVVVLVRAGWPYDKVGADQRRGVAFDWYNMACVFSRSKHVELGTLILEQSFNWGYTDFAWSDRDLDLTNLRADATAAAMMDAWKKGEKKPGSTPMNVEALKKHIAPLLPEWVKAMQAKPADPKPAGDGAKPAGEAGTPAPATGEGK